MNKGSNMSVANKGGNMYGNAKKLYICLIDFTKAFDRVRHDFEILSKAGVSDIIIQYVKCRRMLKIHTFGR